MGCTEIPLIVAGYEDAVACPMIDSTASLVRAAIRWYESWPDTRATVAGEQRLSA
ncbi:aspartate racemase [Salmonella enterica subsp. arizonae]|uniref:Aspartate racemase n=4 Tax=Salmonella enterica TaxID=28901 RepID=A0A379TGU6_SALER|nr:aspartate racemase [Salmonella enterica subsp. arizonae]